MKLEVFGPRAALGDKPGSDVEGAGGSDAPSPLSAAGDDSLGSDGDCAARLPRAPPRRARRGPAAALRLRRGGATQAGRARGRGTAPPASAPGRSSPGQAAPRPRRRRAPVLPRAAARRPARGLGPRARPAPALRAGDAPGLSAPEPTGWAPSGRQDRRLGLCASHPEDRDCKRHIATKRALKLKRFDRSVPSSFRRSPVVLDRSRGPKQFLPTVSVS